MVASEPERALAVLGELLGERGLRYELAVIGGGAMMIAGHGHRATGDLDAVARRTREGRWRSAAPLPEPLRLAIADVAELLELPHSPRHPWLNDGPARLFDIVGLPHGWQDRLDTRAYGPLTVHVLSRADLIFLKLWSATDARDPRRRPMDLQDLAGLRPSPEELIAAARWCRAKDGTGSGYVRAHLLPCLEHLGLRLDVDDV